MRKTDRATVMAVAVTLGTVAACLAVVIAVASSGDEQTPSGAEGGLASPVAAGETTARADEPAAIRIYRTWQRRRERAWAAGDPDALRALYVAPAVGRADVRLLRGWLDHGVAGVDLSHQLLSYEVLRESERRVRLRVTQRLARSVARSDGLHRPLPRGGAHVQEVVLRRSGEQWLVARVRAASGGSVRRG